MTEMTPADVPEEWMAVAIRAARWGDYSPSNGTQHDQLRRSLAAVLPLHEQQVRERVAAECEELRASLLRTMGARDAYQRSLAEAHTSLAILLIREGGQTELTVAEQIRFPSDGTFITVHNPATGGTVLTYRYKGDGGPEAEHA